MDNTFLVNDLGASPGHTLFKSDTFDHNNIPICVISKVNEVIGTETSINKLVDTMGQCVYLPQVASHHPRFTFSVLKSFIRIVEERVSSFDFKLRFI